MKIGVTTFPGTNCDKDVYQMVQAHGHSVVPLWHHDQFDIKSMDAIIVPGGFSYGDYLRCGAMAARSNVMKSVFEFASKGKPVLGICNGFQILCESGLLPGVLVKNQTGQFIDRWSSLMVKNSSAFFAKNKSKNEKINLPVAHGEGRFYASVDDLDRLQDNGQIWLEYVENFNGSARSIAGVLNKEKNVAGLMPHPERALFDWMGGVDGMGFL